RQGNLLEVDVRIIKLRGGTSRRRLRGRAIGVVPKLHKIGRLRIERESFKDQTDPSHVELAHVLLQLPGRNGRAGDCGIVFGVAAGCSASLSSSSYSCCVMMPFLSRILRAGSAALAGEIVRTMAMPAAKSSAGHVFTALPNLASRLSITASYFLLCCNLLNY